MTGGTTGGVLQVMRWLILALLIVYLILPLLMLGNLTGLTDAVYSNLALRIVDRWTPDAPVATYSDRSALERLETRLAGLSAYEGEAKGAAKTLQVLLLEHAIPDLSAIAPTHAAVPQTFSAGFRPLELDLSATRRNAVLVIPAGPLGIALKPATDRPRARLAIESGAPVEIAGGYPGLIAGYRIAAFGDWRTTRPAHLAAGENPAAFCNSLRVWRRHFGVARKDVWLTTIENPHRITVTDLDVVHDGRERTDLPKLNLFCDNW